MAEDSGNYFHRLCYSLNLLTTNNRPPEIGYFIDKYSKAELQKELKEREKFAKKLIECKILQREVDTYIKERCAQ
ncbi:hypothetical protein [Lactobacillus sp.]|uniref:hypothetical protein n=1 Tax=Lactobacillus sp. TaxID=1591 RepID=UPI0019B98108|nr:hypothetical protein [Lactobacillus sp.]MBD5429094.1 hypothetical protein [Lactobacillus sp.]MBD5430463.1 hypothetical protein [Lactobacillus sp.]MBD5430592.1 hypothetical protein [Lactobacillus sp.]